MPPTDRLLPVLIATGALCVVGLTIRRAPALAWLAAVAAATLAAIEIVGAVRTWQPSAGAAAWPWLTGLAAIAALTATSIAGAFAIAARERIHPGRVRLAVTGGTIVVVGAVVVVEAWALAAAAAGGEEALSAPDLWPIRAATRVMLGAVTGLAIVGSLEVLVPRAARARRRLVAERAARPTSDRGHATGRYAALLAEELLPGVSAGRRQAAEAERASIAAELHATIVPELRRAVAAAERAPGEVAGHLRSTLDDVEQLMASRHSVVLDAYGLVAALEWLAERTEDRSRSRVTLDVLDIGRGDAGRPPLAAERAAFRIALLALDNVRRHAPEAAVQVEAGVSPRAIHLEVADDGPGLAAGARERAARDGRRGLVDMAAEAAGVAGRIDVRSPDVGGTGTRITFDWPAA
jgi:signal transduction histidine kinase